jgi:hypothetical protein
MIVRDSRDLIGYPPISKSKFRATIPVLAHQLSAEATQLLRSLEDVRLIDEGEFVDAFV